MLINNYRVKGSSVSKITKKYLFFVFCFYIGMGFESCQKFIEVPPPITQLVSSEVYSNDASATAVITGIYSRMMQSTGFASLNTSLYGGLSADEFQNQSPLPDQGEFYANALTPSNTLVDGLWGEVYQYIYTVNALLEGLQNSSGVSAATKNQLTGEAHFVRAFCYFYLINLFGDVPLVTQTLYTINSRLARTQKDQVYAQILTDLQDAQTRLPADYSSSDGEKVRPNQLAATALLSRVYLYVQDWSDAEIQSSALINNASLGLLGNLDSVFLANSNEAIWQLKPNANANTWEGNTFILLTNPTSVSLSASLPAAFEFGDLRRLHWVDSISLSGQVFYFPFKYKVQTSQTDFSEYSMVIRLAEQYLIRAEAWAEQVGKLSGAISDLNTIRNRAGLPNLSPSLTQAEVLQAIAQERRIELFSEWGHRWFDLQRTNTASSVLAATKPGYQASDSLYPIPISEIKNDPNLSQNAGY